MRRVVERATEDGPVWAVSTVDVDAVPPFDGVRELAEAGTVPGGSRRNRERVAAALDIGLGITETDVAILSDAQTGRGSWYGYSSFDPGSLTRS